MKKLKLKRRMLLNKKEVNEEEDEEEITDEISIGGGTEKKKKKGAQAIVWRDNSDRYRMLVCPKFLTGKCTLTTCPLAHPGLRDSAPVRKRRQSKTILRLQLLKKIPISLISLIHNLFSSLFAFMFFHFHFFMNTTSSCLRALFLTNFCFVFFR